MLNFPRPYPDELIYSVVARAGIRHGITSPKMLLDEVFDDRKVIATVDLPNHLASIAGQYPETLGYSTESLAYQHTLFPVYAPFTTENRRLNCLNWMISSSQGAIHLALGVAASRIKQERCMCYCPQCLEEQKKTYGEYYWARQWQLAGANCCIVHGKLHAAKSLRHEYHRHQFFPASPELCPAAKDQQGNEQDRKVAIQTGLLLSSLPAESASFEQWSQFYKRLALQAGCNRGQQIWYESLRDRVCQYWTMGWLNAQGLNVSDDQSCWLRGIFRKHRKSFSYLEHIVALAPFLTNDWRITDVISQVKVIHPPMGQCEQLLPERQQAAEAIQPKRNEWHVLVAKYGPKGARKGNSALYAWLYRHDQAWLLDINHQFRQERPAASQKINWHRRDNSTVRKLITIRDEYEPLLGSPRWSKSWYLSKLQKSAASIEKNPDKYPLVHQFFHRYCEQTTDYQIRRITRSLLSFQYPADRPERWQLLRMSGLSDERITPITNRFLQEVLKYHAGNTI